jgi:hypothetical protein
LERQAVPVPPSHPIPYGKGWSDEPVAGTKKPRPHPPCGPRNNAEASRCDEVSWSVVMRATDSGERMRSPFLVPPANSIETKDQ